MKMILQRVSHASVSVNDQCIAHIQQGLLIFLGIAHDDTQMQADDLVLKVIHLRCFDDDQGKMNCSLEQVKGSILLVSQFTLYGNCEKGRRPSFDEAALPDKANALYEYVIAKFKSYQVPVQTGQFRANMQVQLLNDGPVTFILEKRLIPHGHL